MAGWTLAIDFGTTFTTAAMVVDGAVSMLEVQGVRRLPSTVLLDEDGQLLVGVQAERQAARAPDRVERTPKRYIGRRVLMLGGATVEVATAVGAVLAAAYDEARRVRRETALDEVLLTHPAGWAAVRLDGLRSAATAAGISEPSFLPEPVAAAAHFAERIRPGRHVAVYDFGGGTFDTAVLRRTDGGFEVVGSPGGLPLGGENLDHALFKVLGATIAADDPKTWRSLQAAADRPWQLARAALLAGARDAKESLSRTASAVVYVPEPVDRELLVTSGEFERLVADDIVRTVDELAATVTGAGLRVDQLAGLYLAGGSSRIPLVGRVIAERLGRRPETLDEPKEVVARGAVQAAVRSVEERSPSIRTPSPALPPVPEPVDAAPVRVHPPRPRSPLAWLAVAAALAVVAVLAVGARALLDRPGGTPPDPPAPGPPSSEILFADDFSSPTSGWTQLDTDDGTIAYGNGRYRVLLKAPESSVVSDTALEGPAFRKELTELGDVSVITTVRRGAGPDGLMGPACRVARESSRYQGLIDTKGSWVVSRYDGLRAVNLAEGTAVAESAAASDGVIVRLDCFGGAGAPTTLRLWVNGAVVGEAVDATALAPGMAGLVVTTAAQGGVEAFFDDFEVRPLLPNP